MAETISSAANPLVKRMRLLANRKYRREQGAFVVEGLQPVWRAVTAGWDIEALIVDPDLRPDSPAAEMVVEQEARGVRVARLTRDLFDRLSSRDGSVGLAAIVRSRSTDLSDLTVTPGAVFIALHQIGNPGNLGTIIRTADAVGSAGVILLGDTTDPFAPTSVKASMGSIFAIKVAHTREPGDFLGWARANRVAVLAASGTASVDHWNASYQPPLTLLLGSEGEGLPEGLLAAAAQRVRIPMTGTAESLNVAAAAAILLYEVRRSAFIGPSCGDGTL
ncbi:MAG TPA: RNA methyltransferase [Streptosporangiaceae bacterium]|nr:RNA methyltransferase [Streptosporangiaceae bacterium]